MTLFRNTIAAVAVAAGLLAANTASAFERWVDVVNNGNYAIYSVHITNVDDRSYGRDLLGEYMIPAGYEMRVEPDHQQRLLPLRRPDHLRDRRGSHDVGH